MSTEISTLLVRSSEVCGGQLRVEGTEITVAQIAGLYREGYTAEAISDRYPKLTMVQVYAALAYYHANQREIETDLGFEKEETDSTKPVESIEPDIRLNAFKNLQRSLGLTTAKAAEWQKAIGEARR